MHACYTVLENTQETWKEICPKVEPLDTFMQTPIDDESEKAFQRKRIGYS